MSVDILMVTHRRPVYTRRALGRLLDTLDRDMRVWLWHNGDDAATLEVVRSFLDHPRVFEHHHSSQNVGLHEPTNWLWTHATGAYLSKVDDDCVVATGWVDTLRRAHEHNPSFGIVGSWRFPDEDFVPRLARRKIREFEGGHQLLQNLWVQGSGYLMKRACVEQEGILRPGESFSTYGIRLATAGWTNGWYYPFVREDHLDDPRSPATELRTDEDLRRRMPLSAASRGVDHLDAWLDQIRLDAREVQGATLDPRAYTGTRRRLRSVNRRVRAWLSQRRPRWTRTGR